MLPRSHTRSQRQDLQARRSLRLAALGRYNDAVAALSQSPPTDPSATTCAQLESLHPTADSIPDVPPRTPCTISCISSAHILRAISSPPRGSTGGRDSMRPQLLQDILRRTAAPLRDRTLSALADLVVAMLTSPLSPSLGPLLASASLVGIPKLRGGIRPIAVGLTLRRLAGKVALCLNNDDISTHLRRANSVSVSLKGPNLSYMRYNVTWVTTPRRTTC